MSSASLEQVPSVAVFRVEGKEEEEGLAEGGSDGGRGEERVRRGGRDGATEGRAEVYITRRLTDGSNQRFMNRKTKATSQEYLPGLKSRSMASMPEMRRSRAALVVRDLDRTDSGIFRGDIPYTSSSVTSCPFTE